MIVEFIGAPGAGKTSLLPVVVEFLAAREFTARTAVEAARPFTARAFPGSALAQLAPIRWQGPILWQMFYLQSKVNRLRFLGRHGHFVWSVWRFQRTRPIGRADRHHVWHWFYHHTGVYEFLRRRLRPDEALLFDEGFIHRVVQLFASENETADPEAVRGYVDQLPRPDLLIYPRATLDVCARRVYARGLWDRFQNKMPAETARFLAQTQVVVQWAVERARENGWLVVEVDNGGDDLVQTKAALLDALGALSTTCLRSSFDFNPQPVR
jgi:hypothetical protein